MAGRSRGSRPGDSLLASAEGEGHPMVPNFVPYGTKFRCPVRPCDLLVPGENWSARAIRTRYFAFKSRCLYPATAAFASTSKFPPATREKLRPKAG